MDYSVVTFINEVKDYVPENIQTDLWSYSSKLVGLAKFTPRQASAMLDRINAVALMIKMSIPARKLTPTLILDLENFINHAKVQVWRATLPRNERELLATQTTETIVKGEGKSRKKFLGII